MAKYEWQPSPRVPNAHIYGPAGCGPDDALGYHGCSGLFDLFGLCIGEVGRSHIEQAVARAERLLSAPAAPAITLPAGWVAHTPYLAERTADRAVVVMDQHGEAAPYFSRSATPGAGRFGSFYHLRAAVEFYDKQWPARPAGWTWQAADENHGAHWRRDADGFRVTETLDQWRGVTPDGYMTTGYYKTAEAVMTFAEQTRPVK